MNTDRGQTALSLYRVELGRRKALSAEVERELAFRWKAGDRQAWRRMIEACLPFVYSIAGKYLRWGLPMEDLVQEGNLGLLRALDRFDPDRGCRLVTYASYWIRAYVREYVTRSYRMVRHATTKAERRALRIYRRTREQDPAALAEMSGLSADRTAALLPLLMAADVRLEHSASPDGPTPGERLADGAGSPEEQVDRADARHQIEVAVTQVVAELSPREQRIVRQRLMAEEPETLERLGVELGVSKERVRQIEASAKKRMRARLTEIAGELVASSA